MAINNVVAKLGQQALSKAASRTEQLKPVGGQGGFAEVLNNMQSAQDFAQSLGMTSGKIESAEGLRAIPGNGVDFSPVDSMTKPEGPQVSRKVVDMLSEVNDGQIQMDSLINQILHSNNKFNPQELLAIQAHVNHYAQMAELTVKVAEHGISSTKQVLNTQVQ
jgi:hypothetical protein